MTNNIDNKHWFENIVKISAAVGACTLISGVLIATVAWLSSLSEDLTKMILTSFNLVVLAYAVGWLFYKRQHLHFKGHKSKKDEKIPNRSDKHTYRLVIQKPNEGDEYKRQYWKLLNFKLDGDWVEIEGEQIDCIERAEFNETRVNSLVKQLTNNILRFAGLLMATYAVFFIDNKIILQDKYFSYHPYLKILEDVFNCVSALFIFFGFMVLYDITLDKENEPFNYKLPGYVILFLFLLSYLFFAIPPITSNATNSSDTERALIENINKETSGWANNPNAGLLNKIHLMTARLPESKDDKINLIYSIKVITNPPREAPLNDARKTELETINKIRERINSYIYSLDKLAPNILQLIIGSFNGLAMALLFGRYISMEHSLENIKKENYNEYIRWGIIIILPVYALAQPLFGSFEIDAFGSPATFANIVFFICLIGKIFFLYVTSSFMKKKLLHYYLHLVLTNHGVPKEFYTCFETDSEKSIIKEEDKDTLLPENDKSS